MTDDELNQLGGSNTHDTRALEEQIAELSSEQRAVLDAITLAWHNRNSGFDALGHALTRGKSHGITWGMVAFRLGIAKPAIWRWYQRWRKGGGSVSSPNLGRQRQLQVRKDR